MTTTPMTSAADAAPQRRKVRLDFHDSDARWNPRHEQFAYLANAISTLLPYLERFLVDCVDGAIDKIPESKTQLRQEMADFCYQERRHNANHVKFNRMIASYGYEQELADAEPYLVEYYANLRTKGDRFGLAWCEGFETVAPFVGVFMFEHGEEFGGDHRDRAREFLADRIDETQRHRRNIFTTGTKRRQHNFDCE